MYMYIPTVVRYISKRSSAELPLQGLDPFFLLFLSAFRFPLSVPSGLFVSDNLIDKMTNLCMYVCMYVHVPTCTYMYLPDVGGR